MTKLEEILERVERWPAQRQDDVLHAIERMEEAGIGTYQLSEEEHRLIDEGLTSSLVSDEDVETFWKRHEV
jgi:hypothetical protein